MPARGLAAIKRVVLSHADADHRGGAPALGTARLLPRGGARGGAVAGPIADYWDLEKLDAHGRVLLSKALPAGTEARSPSRHVAEGDEVAGFRVIELPGHSPGLIGLFRDSDRLALVSDCVYTLDPQTGLKGPAHVPASRLRRRHRAGTASIRKLAELEPSAVWAGHADPVTGDVSGQLRAAAAAANLQ